jgi:YVTN family beta-propeller protein
VHVARRMVIPERSPRVPLTSSACALPGHPARALVLLALVAGCGGGRPHGPRVFVTNEKDGTVTAIDAHSFAVLDTIKVGKRPRGLHVSPDGRWLYVALSGSPIAGPGVDEASLPPPNRGADGIGIVDLDAMKLVRAIASGEDPESFDVLDDHTLVVSNEETAQASIVDIGSRQVKSAIDIGKEPEGVAIAPDHTAWVTSEGDSQVFIIDPVASTVLGKIPTGARPRGIAFTNGKAFITNENAGTLTVADVAKRAPIATITLPAGGEVKPRPMGVTVSKGRVYVTEGRAKSVAIIDAMTNDVVTTIPDVGARPWGIAVAASGLVFTANGPSNDVTVLDPQSGQIVRRIPTGASPWGVAIAP